MGDFFSSELKGILMKDHGFSLDNIKSKAKKIKKQLGITYTAALEQVAKDLGYSNWKHCQRSLSSQPIAPKPQQEETPTINFNDWLKRHKNRDSPLGDLAKEMLNDQNWPLHATLGEYQAYILTLHLRRGASAALENAWKSYQRYIKGRKNPKPRKSMARKEDIRRIVIVKNAEPIHIDNRTVEEFNPGDQAWISWDGRKPTPVTILEVDERHYTFRVERPLTMSGSQHFLFKDEVRSSPELACANRVTN